MRHWSFEDWRKINYEDEATFFMNRKVGRPFLRLRRGERNIGRNIDTKAKVRSSIDGLELS